MKNTWTYIQLKPGDLIRTRYKSEWEYSQLIDAKANVFCYVGNKAHRKANAWNHAGKVKPDFTTGTLSK